MVVAGTPYKCPAAPHEGVMLIASEIRGRQPVATFGGDGYCMLESGGHIAGFAFGNFFAEPSPKIELRQTGKTWHLGKILLENGGLRLSAISTYSSADWSTPLPIITSPQRNSVMMGE